MLEFAHFTPTELPGTLAIWVAGIGLGLALASPARRSAAPPLILLAALAGLGMLGDSAGWAEPLRMAIDVAFLVAAALLAGVLWSKRQAHSPPLTSQPSIRRQ